MHKNSEKITKGRTLTQGEKYDKVRGSIKFEHTSTGSKLINLIGAFECAFYMFACMAQVLNFNIHAYVMYARCKIE